MLAPQLHRAPAAVQRPAPLQHQRDCADASRKTERLDAVPEVVFRDVWPVIEHQLQQLLEPAVFEAVVRNVKQTERAHLWGTLFEHNPADAFNCVERRRYSGFGKRSLQRSVTHDVLSPFWLMHMAWRFWSPAERQRICNTAPILMEYASLRRVAFAQRIEIRQALRAPRKPPELEPQLDPTRTLHMGAALLSFNFDYGDLVRWLGGEYTNDHRDWNSLQKHVDIAMESEQRPGYPTLEPDIAMRSFREGVPLRGNIRSLRADMLRRVEYDNHPPLTANLAATREKFGKEEAKSFHIAFPRFVVHFILGIMIAPISWVVRKGKGRLIIDASTTLHEDDTGAVNSQIPKPGTPDRAQENPAVFYGSALVRHLIHIYNLRLQFPNDDILQHTDDIDSAFRRVLYHPDLAIAFAYVFMELLLMPIGMIFGGKNSPSFWSVPAEVRAHLGAVLAPAPEPASIAEQVQLAPELSPEEASQLVPAVPDALNQGIAPEYADRPHLAMFVDDDIVAAIRSHMREALRAAVASAYLCFGNPDDDRRGSCLVAEKFPMTADAAVIFVGYCIDTRKMRVTWPDEKVQSLAAMLDDWLHTKSAKSPSQIAKLLGFVRNGAFLCQQGNFLSIRLQWTLNAELKKAGAARTQRKKWWSHNRVHIPREVFEDLHLLRATCFNRTTYAQHQWSRPIAMLIPREPTCVLYSDAAHSGLGGWSADLRFVWRLTRDDMVTMKFKMEELDDEGRERNRWCKAQDLPAGHEELLHINPLEFIAIIINVWFAITIIRKAPIREGGHHILIRADNTSALSWLKYAARSHRPHIRNLAYFLHGFILFSQTSEDVNITGQHLPGIENKEADAVSRPELYPSLGSAIEAFSPLQTCQPYRIPCGVLSTLARWTSLPEIEAKFEPEMTNLLSLEPEPFPPGAINTALASGIYRRARRERS